MTAASRGGAPPTAQAIAEALACGRPGCGCGKREGKGFQTHCPAHADANPSLSIAVGDDGKLLAHCHAGCPQEAVIAALRERELWPSDAQQRPRQGIVTTYDYRDEQGLLLYQVVRKPGKVFQQRRPDGKGGWAWNLEGVRRVPYRLPGLLAADPAEWVHVVEGEKDANNLSLLGLVATTNPGGAGKWREEFGPYLQGRRVAILPDNDTPGLAHAQDVAHKLAPHAANVRIVVLPGLSPGGDVSDWLKLGHKAGELMALVDAAPSWRANTYPSDVGGTVADVEPPNLASLLDDVRALIRRYVIVDDAQADALALWAAHTHALAAAEATPYLAVNSAEKRSGKTRLLETLSLLVARPWLTGRVTAAMLVRKLAKETPTLLLDESDAAFKAEKEYAATLQAILNSGYRHGGCASLCVKVGGDFDLRDFPVFGPKAIAGIGTLPDTIADRAIPIALKRRAPNEPIARFRWRDAQEEAKLIREGLASWASSNTEALTEARPSLPPELDDRAADVWEPLFAIADVAGGDWPQRARLAALALSVGDGRDNDSLGVRLLADVRAVFDERKADRLSSGELAEALVAIEEAPWGDLRGKPLEARTLARRLRPYGIKPRVIRIGDATARGYERADFEDAWGRYIPIPDISVTTVTSVTTTPSEYERERPDVTDVTDVTANPGVQAPLTESDDRPPAAPCSHRPPGEVEDRWAHGDGGPDAHVCRCCGGSVHPDLWIDGLCPPCRNGQLAKDGSGHLVRLALDMGATLVEKGG